jgi:hypothetical protein
LKVVNNCLLISEVISTADKSLVWLSTGKRPHRESNKWYT